MSSLCIHEHLFCDFPLLELTVTVQVLAQLKFDVPVMMKASGMCHGHLCSQQAMYDFHKKSNVVIEVDLIRIQVPPSGVPPSLITVIASSHCWFA